MKQKAKLVFSESTRLLASHIIDPQSNQALAGRLTPAQLQLVQSYEQKLRTETYKAAVCKFRQAHFMLGFVWFRVWHSSAQPFIIFLVFLRWSRQYFAFVELIDLDLNDDDIEVT